MRILNLSEAMEYFKSVEVSAEYGYSPPYLSSSMPPASRRAPELHRPARARRCVRCRRAAVVGASLPLHNVGQTDLARYQHDPNPPLAIGFFATELEARAYLAAYRKRVSHQSESAGCRPTGLPLSDAARASRQRGAGRAHLGTDSAYLVGSGAWRWLVIARQQTEQSSSIRVCAPSRRDHGLGAGHGDRPPLRGVHRSTAARAGSWRRCSAANRLPWHRPPRFCGPAIC